MYRFLHILLLFVFTLGVRAQEACSQEEQAKADAFYYDAMNERLKGNHAEAFQLFTHALAVNPTTACRPIIMCLALMRKQEKR